ncbi:10132_t:CDS:1, partial [Racocetra fulgida]
MNSDDLVTEDQLNHQKNQLNKKNGRKSNKDYVEAQLKAYISKLKSTKQYDDVEPISIDTAEWSTYIRSRKEFSDKLKSDAEFAYVGALFSHVYKVMEVANTNNNALYTDKLRKSWIKANLEDSIVETSITQMNRVKQAYDHILYLISKFDDQKIPMTKWNPLLNK